MGKKPNKESLVLVKAMRYQIFAPTENSWKEVGGELRRIQKICAETANVIMNELYQFDFKLYCKYVLGLGYDYKEFKKVRESKTPETARTNAYTIGRNHVGYDKKISSNILSQLCQNIEKRWNIEWFDVLFTKKRTLSTFKNTYPIQIHNRGFVFEKDAAGDYYVKISIFDKTEENRWIKFRLYNSGDFKKENNRRTILDRIIAGEYTQSSGQLLYNENCNKWEIIVSYRFLKPVNKSVDPDIRVGVDLGIRCPAVLAISNKPFARLAFSGINEKIRRFNNNINATRRQIQNNGKNIFGSRSGHGRKRKLLPITKLQNRIDGFRKNINHYLSKTIVDFCITNNAGVIVMEKLSGIKDEKDNIFLNNWSYFELQQFIQYKAAENGIKIEFIEPQYTSQRCHICGAIYKANRNGKDFKCLDCKTELDADFNAAKNIATPGIETIIKDWFEKLKETKNKPLKDEEDVVIFAKHEKPLKLKNKNDNKKNTQQAELF